MQKGKKKKANCVHVWCLSAQAVLQGSQQRQSYNLLHAELLRAFCSVFLYSFCRAPE